MLLAGTLMAGGGAAMGRRKFLAGIAGLAVRR
jgi:hypothetical protein